MANLSPIVSEFETDEQAASYDRWFRAKVAPVWPIRVRPSLTMRSWRK